MAATAPLTSEVAAKGRRIQVLLVPNVSWWVIGDMARQIMRVLGDSCDFYFLPESLIARRPDLTRRLLAGVDVVHCLNESGATEIATFLDRESPPLVTWIHHITQWSPDHQNAARLSKHLVSCTAGWKEVINRHTSLPITVVPHGVDASLFSRVAAARQKFGIPEKAFVVGFLGSKGSDHDHQRKGTDTLLEVLTAIAPHIPELLVFLCGPGWEGEVRRLTALGIKSKHLGFVRRSLVPAFYSSLDAYLMTSRVEGGPVTVLEAMACETPVVATRVGLVPELVEDGVTGYGAAAGDAAGLAKSLTLLAAHRPAARAMGRRARQAILERSWDNTLQPLAELYSELGSQYPREPAPLKLAPQRLLPTAVAADCYFQAAKMLRKGSRGAMRTLRASLQGISFADRVRGLALARGWSLRGGQL